MGNYHLTYLLSSIMLDRTVVLRKQQCIPCSDSGTTSGCAYHRSAFSCNQSGHAPLPELTPDPSLNALSAL